MTAITNVLHQQESVGEVRRRIPEVDRRPEGAPTQARQTAGEPVQVVPHLIRQETKTLPGGN